jgi:hypothetical protein
MNFVGINTSAASATSPYQWYLEKINPVALYPQDIQAAMKQKRLPILGD